MRYCRITLACVVSIFTIILTATSCRKALQPDPAKQPGVTQTRIYYIAAVEQEWDYAPSGMNLFMGMPFDVVDSTYAVNIPTGATPRIGRKNIKARFVEYTDGSFSTPKVISAEWEHLGILGPVIRANVGDSVVVYFKNMTANAASIHVHGLLYDVNSEGAVYNNGATSGSSIDPGGQYMYKYFVREDSGPGPSQGSSIVWLYHSHVMMDESDIYAGLVGAIVVCQKGKGNSAAKPIDIDREFVTLFMVFDENSSEYLDTNIDTYLPGFTNPDPDDFAESNKKHTINGMFMGNLPGLVMNKGEKVRWYVLALGNEVDLHTPHWHGNTATVNGEHTDVLALLPATMVTVDMIPDNPGKWGFHCHVSDHMVAGMNAFYTVK